MPCVLNTDQVDESEATRVGDSSKDTEPTITELIPLAEAAALSGLSHGHLALLIRRGDLWGIKIGRDWVTTKKAVLDYLTSNPKPGPKPK